jgi:nitrite reductase/ring-hydroxylating ferredoxin subunit
LARHRRGAGLNPVRPPAGTPLCPLAELDDPGARGFRFREGEALFAGFVVRRGEAVMGYVDRCPHAGWPLAMADRYLTRGKDRILCAGHGALFRLEDGHCTSGPCAGEALEPWPVVVKAGLIETA